MSAKAFSSEVATGSRRENASNQKSGAPFHRNGKGSSHFRRTALALPGAVEGAHQRTADFRVGKRIFATLGYPDDAWGMVKLTPEQQSMLVEAEPEIFRPVPGGWGKQGYTNLLLAKADAATLKSALTMAWKNVAPKSQVKARDQASASDRKKP